MEPSNVAELIGAGVAGATGVGVIFWRIYNKLLRPVIDSVGPRLERVAEEIGADDTGTPKLSATVANIHGQVNQISKQLSDAASTMKEVKDDLHEFGQRLENVEGRVDTLEIASPCPVIRSPNKITRRRK